MRESHRNVRKIYAILKEHKIEVFSNINSNIFKSILLKYGFENLWKNMKQGAWQHESIMYPFSDNEDIFDSSFMALLVRVYEKPEFLNFLDDMLDKLIPTKNIEDFEYDEFKQTLIQCGFEEIDIEKMKFWENESKVKKKEHISQVINEFALGTLNNLENSLIHKIYEEIIANPTRYHKESRTITAQRKKAVKMRDEFVCQICNEKFEEDELEVDHIFPYGAGGSNEEYNLMALCIKCNRKKSNRLEYYRSKEGKLNLMENIKIFVKTLPIIHDFGDWLEKRGDRRSK